MLEALVGGDDRDLEVLLKDLAGSSDGILDDREELEELCRQILRDQSE